MPLPYPPDPSGAKKTVAVRTAAYEIHKGVGKKTGPDRGPDLPDAWFQCIYQIFEDKSVHEYEVQRGSFEGIKRRQFDMVMVNIEYPGTRPSSRHSAELGIPQPTSMEYVEDYLQYLMTDRKRENEVYTYGERSHQP